MSWFGPLCNAVAMVTLMVVALDVDAHGGLHAVSVVSLASFASLWCLAAHIRHDKRSAL